MMRDWRLCRARRPTASRPSDWHRRDGAEARRRRRIAVGRPRRAVRRAAPGRATQQETHVRTLIVILIGIVLAVAVRAVAGALARRRAGEHGDGSKLFIGLWAAFVVVDGYVGVTAGHSVASELAIHALVFVIPAGLAWYLAQRGRPVASKPVRD
jgi:hypothetical protein